MEKSNRELKNMRIVLCAAVLCVFLIASAFIFYDGPSGSYVARDAFLDPSVIRQTDGNRKLQLALDKIEFSCFNKTLGKMDRHLVSFDRYEKFYALVSKDVNVSEVPTMIQALSDKTRLLTIQMRAKERSIKTNQLLQDEENYFRIQLKTVEMRLEWAYYPNLYHEITNLFTVVSEL